MVYIRNAGGKIVYDRSHNKLHHNKLKCLLVHSNVPVFQEKAVSFGCICPVPVLLSWKGIELKLFFTRYVE
jgi:hypothetical protein